MIVSGVVQGVGFRWATRDQAEALAVSGWVRNLPDGRVEAEVEGDETAVERMLDWLRHGPPGAVVDGAEVRSIDPAGVTGFAIRSSPPLE